MWSTLCAAVHDDLPFHLFPQRIIIFFRPTRKLSFTLFHPKEPEDEAQFASHLCTKSVTGALGQLKVFRTSRSARSSIQHFAKENVEMSERYCWKQCRRRMLHSPIKVNLPVAAKLIRANL
jgi:hypothetical protein